jgi:hypothetical protein
MIAGTDLSDRALLALALLGLAACVSPRCRVEEDVDRSGPVPVSRGYTVRRGADRLVWRRGSALPRSGGSERADAEMLRALLERLEADRDREERERMRTAEGSVKEALRRAGYISE